VTAGGNLLDTADSYCHWVGAPGISEEILGRWMHSRGNRDAMVVATKVGQLPGQDNLHPATIRAAVDGSLRRLKTDYVDLYYAHEDHGEPLEPTLEAFDELVRAGKVRYVAASNISGARLAQAVDLARDGGLASYVALQPQYNLVHRGEYEHELAAVCQQHRLGTFPWWGLACGFLTGKYRFGGPSVASPRAGFVEPYVNEQGEAVLDALEAVAAEHECSMATVALAWLAGRPAVVSPLASATSIEQLADLVAMVDVSLTAEQVGRLDAASAWSAAV
jgi:aryl-alcohol dehydrogenase (NADP+)